MTENLTVLVVEDDQWKASKITGLMSEPGIEGYVDVEYATSVVGAKAKLKQGAYDLLLLDIQIPDLEGETPKRTGGLELLNLISQAPYLTSPQTIIGITAYEDLFEDAKESFDKRLSALLHAEPEQSDWVEKLRGRVKHLIASKTEYRNGKRAYSYDVGIICALQDTEFESLLRVFPELEEVSELSDPTKYFVGRMKTERGQARLVACYCREMGPVAASSLATKVVMSFIPRYLFMTGIAAGIRGRVGLCDVIVGDPCWEYGSGKHIESDQGNGFEAAPLQVRLQAELHSAFSQMRKNVYFFSQLAEDWPTKAPVPSLHVGPFASGPSVVANRSVLAGVIEQQRKLLAIDMEAYGLMWSAENALMPRPTAAVIKGISDFADPEKSDSYRDFAAYASNRLLREFIYRNL